MSCPGALGLPNAYPGVYFCYDEGDLPSCKKAEVSTCNPEVPDCSEEICGNGLDDDCDDLPDCDDTEDCPDGWAYETCGQGDEQSDDFNCDGVDGCLDPDCLGGPEICGDGIDNDCSVTPGTADPDDTDLKKCESPLNNPLGAGDTERDCGESCSCRGRPVHLVTKQAYVGPHEDVRIASVQGGSFDLSFSRTWDSERAQVDHIDDVGPNSSQLPYPRVLGPGWRHNFDIRLVVDVGPSPGSPGNGTIAAPRSLLFDRPGGQVRLHQVTSSPLVYARGIDDPTTAVRATVLENGGNMTGWLVTDASGDRFFFQDTTGSGSDLHPATPIVHHRLRAIYPAGVPLSPSSPGPGLPALGARVRLFYEQDAAELTTQWCSSAFMTFSNTSGTSTCSSSRGLLVGISQEWWDTATSQWLRGNSLGFRYQTRLVAGAGAKPRVLLKAVVEGADLDASSTTPTIFADFNYTTHVDIAWRPQLTAVASCLDRMGTGDTSGTSCVALNSFRTHEYGYQVGPTSDPTSHLIAVVLGRVNNAAQSANEEVFVWERPPGSSIWMVSTHQSDGIVLTAPGGVPQLNGDITWKINGADHPILYELGRVLEEQRCAGGICTTQKTRVVDTAGADARAPLGFGRTTDGDGVTTLRSYRDDGLVDFEAEVVGNSATTPPTMTFSIPGPGAFGVTFNDTVGWRRVSRNYYGGSPARLIATARLSPVWDGTGVPSGTGNVLFPLTPPTSWVCTACTTHAPPVTKLTLGGIDYFYDVDVNDANSDFDNLLNEADDRLIVWSHHARTHSGGATQATSTRLTFDQALRLTKTEQLSTARDGTTYLRVGRTDTTYLPVTSSVVRDRGRAESQTVYGVVVGDVSTTNPSDLGAQELWALCASGQPRYDELGHLECRESLVTSGSPRLRIKDTTATLSDTDGLRRTVTTTAVVGGASFPSSFVERRPSGFVVRQGTVSGNSTRFTAALSATSGGQVQSTELLASDDSVFRTETSTFDTFGHVTSMTTSNAANVVRRSSSQVVDDRGLATSVSRLWRIAFPSLAITTFSSYDPADGELRSTTEGDGDLINYVDVASGLHVGRLSRIDRSPVGGSAQTSRSFAYTIDGQVSTIRNGGTSSGSRVATYLYDADGRLFEEILIAAGNIKRQTSSTVATKSGIGNVRIDTEKTFPTTTATTPARWIDTWFDARGRILRQCNITSDALCAAPIEQYFYDTKPAGMTGAFAVEGEPWRTIVLTNNNDLNRLTAIKHPAGVTIFEHDAVGRITIQVQNDSSTVTGANMRPTVMSYSTTGAISGVRYPSGRRVDYLYSADVERPTEAFIRINPNGINTYNNIIGDINYEVDDAPIRWRWATSGSVNDRWHNVVRDDIGRVREINDESDGTKKTELDYDGYDNDGDFDTLTDRGPLRPITESGTTQPSVRGFGYDASRDMLVTFNDASTAVSGQSVRSLNLNVARGLRETETTPTSLSYGYSATALELMTARGSQGLTYGLTSGANFATPAEVLTFNGTTLGYGARGEVVTTSPTDNSFALSHARDEQRRRWSYKKTGSKSNFTTLFSYDPMGRMIERKKTFASNGAFERDEYIYLGGVPIGVTHTETGQNPAEVSWFLSPDAMGTPRRVLERSQDLTQVSRLVMFAPGNAACVVNPALSIFCKGQQTSELQGLAVGVPALPFRLPGQIADEETGLSENQYRMYAPILGQYLQPDPLHRASARHGVGPEIYAYAHGNPLRYTDTSGAYAKICCDQKNVSIEMPTAIGFVAGHGSTESALNGWNYDEVRASIESGWSGQKGSYSVAASAPANNPRNVIGLVKGAAGRVFMDNFGAGRIFGNTISNTKAYVLWGDAGPPVGSANVAPHEMGHIMGLDRGPGTANDHNLTEGNMMYGSAGFGSIADKGGFDVDDRQMNLLFTSAGIKPDGCSCGVIP